MLEEDFERLRSNILALQAMRSTIEKAAEKNASLDSTVASLLLGTQQQLEIALGFQTRDDFSICIYKYDAQPEELALLRCVAQHRPVPCDIKNSRTFGEGTGIVGVAHQNKQEFVIPDLSAEGVVSLFDMVADVDLARRLVAKKKYRSMAVFPVLVDGIDKPWGVCTATVDRVGHFTRTQRASSPYHYPVQLLADMIALAVATTPKSSGAHDRDDKTKRKQETRVKIAQ